MDHTVDICSTFLSVSDTGVSVAHHWNLFRDIQVWNISYFLTVVCLLLYSFRRHLNVLQLNPWIIMTVVTRRWGNCWKRPVDLSHQPNIFILDILGLSKQVALLKGQVVRVNQSNVCLFVFFHFNAQDTTVCRITSSSDGQYVAVQCDRWVPVCDSVVVGLCTIYNFTNLTRWAPN